MNTQLSLFEQDYDLDRTIEFTKPYLSISENKDDEERKSWHYSTTKIISREDGTVEVVPAKLKKDGTPKKVPHNSVKGVEKKSLPIKKESDAEAILRYLILKKKPMYSVAFQLGINLGLRGNELLDRKWEDVLDQNGEFRIVWDIEDVSDGLNIDQKKTHKQRRIFLNNACKTILEEYRKVCKNCSGYLFPSREGNMKPITVGMLDKVIKEAGKACDIPYRIGTHSMRQTWGYHQYNRMGCTESALISLQHFFGHTSPIITMRYIGIFGEEEKMAFHEGSYDVFSKVLDDLGKNATDIWR